MRRLASTLALAFLLPGCSMSMLGGDDLPRTTGSITPPVQVDGPLPTGLAFSDAAKIGEAANAALLQAKGPTAGDWINAATGSSGTVETVSLDSPPSDCKPFSTTVTSIGGVHEYSGAICDAGVGPPRLKIDERSPLDRS